MLSLPVSASEPSTEEVHPAPSDGANAGGQGRSVVGLECLATWQGCAVGRNSRLGREPAPDPCVHAQMARFPILCPFSFLDTECSTSSTSYSFEQNTQLQTASVPMQLYLLDMMRSQPKSRCYVLGDTTRFISESGLYPTQFIAELISIHLRLQALNGEGHSLDRVPTEVHVLQFRE